MEFPKYANGLYLHSVEGDTAIYRRPRLTGCWGLEAQIKDNKVVCTDCVAPHVIGMELKEMTEEEFIADNGGYSLNHLLDA